MAQPAVTIQLRGFEALDRRLEALPKRVENACFRKALRSTGTKIAKRMKAATPRLAGTARGSVKVKVKVRRGGAYARIGYTKRPAAYIAMGDRGTRHQPARPFFKAATSGWERDANRDFSDALKQAVETAEAIAV